MTTLKFIGALLIIMYGLRFGLSLFAEFYEAYPILATAVLVGGSMGLVSWLVNADWWDSLGE